MSDSNLMQEYEATVGDDGKLILPVPGGFASLGLKTGSRVYVSLTPSPFGNGAYPATPQMPIIIVTGDPKKAESPKPQVSEVYKRL